MVDAGRMASRTHSKGPERAAGDDWRVTRFDRWEYQWQRAWRWYVRTLDACGRGPGPASEVDAQDFAEVFVQSIWHLKDWLVHDATQDRLTGTEIESYVDTIPELRVVADLANGRKHALLTRQRRSTGALLGFPMWIGEEDPDLPSTVGRVWVTVESPDWPEPREVVDVAHGALVAWESLLLKPGLSPPQHEEPDPTT